MKKKTKNILTGVGILTLVILGVFVFGTQQSILSQSSVKLDNGKVYWVLQGSANSYSTEYYTFNPSTYKYQDGSGTEVRPQEGLQLGVSKIETQCEYLTTLKTLAILPPFDYRDYYVLNNPEKIANVNFADGNGQTLTIDGTTVQEGAIEDPDGRGELIIQTQGLLGGKYNCPSYENVVFFPDDKRFFDRYQWEINKRKVLNSQFTSTLDEVIITSSNVVLGDINIGNVVFTVTADQDYFDSVIYTPPRETDPNIVYIQKPSEIQQGQSSSIVVGIRNDNTVDGNVIITTSGGFTYSPSSRNEFLRGSSTDEYTFNIQASNEIGKSTGEITACGSSQFSGSVNCDNELFSIDIIEGTPQTSCGNNICEFNEDKNTCPQDCTIQQEPIGECEPYDFYFFEFPNIFCIISSFFAKIRAIAGIIAFAIGTFLSRNIFKDMKKIEKNKWLVWLLSIGVGIISLYLVYTLFWLGVILLIVFAGIKIIL